MEQNLYTTLKQNIESPRLGLERDIMRNIYAYQTRRNTIRLWSSVLVGVASLIGLVPAVLDVGTRFRQSGFYEYLSLIFSNTGVFSTYSKDLAMALGESIPVFSIIVFLSVVFVLLWSVRNIFEQSSVPHFKLSI